MPKTFGKVLKEARKSLRMKQEDVARLVGVSQSTYNKYENDNMKNVSIDFVQKVYAILEIDANKLFNISQESFASNEKKKIIEQFENCINETRKLKIAKLDEYLSKISEDKGFFSIRYGEFVYTINKLDSCNFIGLCCIITIYTSEMLKLIDTVAEERGIDEKLANLYVLYKKLMMNILIK